MSFTPIFQANFWAQVRRGEGGWEWTGARRHDGYDLLDAPDRDRLRRREPAEEVPRGYLILAEISASLLPDQPGGPGGGWEGVLLEIRVRPNRELRWCLR